jgi:hypothetical protein
LQLSQNATKSDLPAGERVPSAAPRFRGEPGSGATLPVMRESATAGETNSQPNSPGGEQK